MYETILHDMDMHRIMDSGQAFRIHALSDNSFLALAGNRALLIRQNGEQVSFYCSEDRFRDFWYDYFDLETDYAAIRHSVDPDDSWLTGAVSCGIGIRILRQDLWETLISFLISQNNNIHRIRNSIQALCERFGGPVIPEEPFPTQTCREIPPLRAFPSPEALCSGGLKGLQGLGLGYRDKYILHAAGRCCGPAGKDWLHRLSGCDYDSAMEMLLQESGIGRKVADCICLFALHHVDAFPVDTHIRQILDTHYPDGFPFARYQGYAGILQQYMFFYKRSAGRQKGGHGTEGL